MLLTEGQPSAVAHQHSMCLYPFQAMVATTSPRLQERETLFKSEKVKSLLTFLAKEVKPT